MAIVMATKIIAPNIWGWIADKTNQRMVIVRIGCLLAALLFSGVLVSHNYWWLVLILMGYSFFWNAALPQFEATTFTHLGDNVHRYSSIRVWGSVGFIIAVVVLGPVLTAYGISLLPVILLLLLGALWVMSLWVPERTSSHYHLSDVPLKKILQRPEVFTLLAICFLMQASHGPYYTFYTIYMESHGYGRSQIGQLWALGTCAEVGVFMLMHRLVPYFGLRRLLLTSLALTSLRWILIGILADNLGLIIFAQTLHAASFGVYHAVAIQLIHSNFTGKHQGKGQALYSSISFGAGGALGSLYSGYAWSSIGATMTYLIAAMISVCAFVLAWFSVPRDRGNN